MIVADNVIGYRILNDCSQRSAGPRTGEFLSEPRLEQNGTNIMRLERENEEQVRYPRRPFVKSGYIVLPKSIEQKKSAIIERVAEKMQQNRKQKTKER